MDKISYIDEYIQRCDDIISRNDVKEADLLESEIIGVFSSEISNITQNLEAYGYGEANYINDIKMLRQKLKNHKFNLQNEKEKMAHDLELARLSQPSITAHAESNQSQSQSSNINVNISIEHTIKQINEIQEEELSADEKEQLKDYLYSLEGIKSSKDKNKFWEKTKEVLKFLADKGADATIAMLPYIIQGLSTLS